MSVSYRPGFYCDVCVLADGRFAHVVAEDPDVVAYVDGGVLWRTKAGRGLLELRCAFALGRVYAIGKEKDSAANVRDGGTVYLVTRDDAKPLGLAFGAQSVAIDATYAYIVRSNQSYDRITLATGEVEHLPHGVPGSSQGISDVRNGEIWWADLRRTSVFPGGVMSYPNTRGWMAVGQCDPPQIAGWLIADGEVFTAIEGESYEPHLAQSGDRYAICARTPRGAAFTVVPPFPAFISGAPAPIPVPQPKPEDPKPMSIQLPQNVKSIRDRFVAQFPVPQKVSAGPADDAFENLCRAWVLKLAQTVAALTGNPAWGVKNAGGSRPQSKDSLAFFAGGQLVNFDLLSGVGTGHPSLVGDPQGEDITGQTFMPVTPLNWLVDTSTPPQEPAPLPPAPPAPTVSPEYLARLSAIEDALKAVEEAGRAQREAMATLADAVKLLNAKPAPKYSGRIGGTGRFSTAIDLVPIA